MSHDSGTTTPFIADIEAWTGSSVETLRLGTHSFTTRPGDVPPNAAYLGLISDIGSIDRHIFEGDALSGEPSINAGYIEFNNTGALDDWLDYGFDGRLLTVYRLGFGTLYSSREQMFVGTMVGIDASNAYTTIRLRTRDRMSELKTPYLTERFLGDVDGPGIELEGGEDLKDQIKPRIWGTVRNISPKLVNPYSLLYQVNFGSVTSITVKMGGQALVSAGNFVTVADLVAATLGAGEYGTCFDAGVFRLESSPTHPVTADVVEMDRSIAGIALAILEDYGVEDLDLDSFTDADTFNNASGGVYIDTSDDVLTIVSAILDSLGMALIPDLLGEFSVVILRDPVSMTSVETFDLNNVSADTQALQLLSGQGTEGDGIPAYSFVLNYNRNYTPMDVSQLAGALSDADKAILGETFKTTVVADDAVLEAHPLAVELTKETFITNEVDAIAEAERQLDLYKVRRDRVKVTIHDEDADDIDLGDCVTLVLSRFGYDAGKKFLVLGKLNEFNKRVVTLSLWG